MDSSIIGSYVELGINTHMSVKSLFYSLSYTTELLYIMDQSTHRHRSFSLLTDTTQGGVKSVTFHCEYLDNEGKCRFYIICITFYIDS